MSARFVKVPAALLHHASQLGLDDGGLLRLTLCLLSFDWGNGRPVKPSQDTLAAMCEVNVKTVQRRSERLVKLGLIKRERPQRRASWHYDLAPLYRRLDALAETTAGVASNTVPETTASVASSEPPEATLESVRSDIEGTFEATPWVSPYVDPLDVDHPDIDPHTHRARDDERRVCEEIAREILAEFNRQAGTSYEDGLWLAMIAERVAEQPKLTLDAHREVIGRNLAKPWWSGAPSPSVLYRDAAAFDRARNQNGSSPQYESKDDRRARRNRARADLDSQWDDYLASTRNNAEVIEGTAEEIEEPAW